MKTYKLKQQSSGGFALLISLLVVGVVITVGLSVLDVSVTQVRLSNNAEQSEIAFNAANAGLECAQYHSRSNADDIFMGTTLAGIQCFGNPADFDIDDDGFVDDNGTPVASGGGDGEVSGTGSAFVYEYQFDWSGSVPRCSRIYKLALNAPTVGSNLIANGMSDFIAGYPETTFTCTGGSRCTILSVRGYNKSCSDIGTFGTTERQVLLQF